MNEKLLREAIEYLETDQDEAGDAYKLRGKLVLFCNIIPSKDKQLDARDDCGDGENGAQVIFVDC